MDILSLRVRGRGCREPSSLAKKAGTRSSGGASLSLSAPSSARIRWRFSTFLVFFRASTTACNFSSSAAQRAESEASAWAFAAASARRASAASATAATRAASAMSLNLNASSFSARACSASAADLLASLAEASRCRSASRCLPRASSMRRTCSATISFAFSSSPSSCEIWPSMINFSSECRVLISCRCLSLRPSTVSSCSANMQACMRRCILIFTTVSRRVWARFLRILR
mmetsp:Transcript_69725/g.151713  ORF Transcript_69725/g.151713 Transcript_69725/m.151713 type:complete len:230 (+) Transcript_69725:384-1073(+)